MQRFRPRGPVEQDLRLSFGDLRRASFESVQVSHAIPPPEDGQRTRAATPEAISAGARVPLRAVVRELERDAEVVCLDGRDGLLQVVLALAEHADLVALDLRLDLDPARLHELRDLLGLLLGDAGHDRDRLAHVALRGGVDLAFGERLQRHVALHDLLFQDLERGLEPVLGRRPQLDRRVILGDAGLGVFEVEPLRDLALRLVDGVADLLQVHLGDDVEGGLVFRHAREDTVPGSPPPPDRGFATMSRPGRMPEWPKGAVCKIAGVAYGGSNPPPPTDVERQISSLEHPLSGCMTRSRPR